MTIIYIGHGQSSLFREHGRGYNSAVFTGLVERLGRVVSMKKGRLVVDTGWDDVREGESVAVNGCCLTWDRGGFHAVPETLKRTNLGDLRAGDRVNLERALRAADRLGGHFVQGHVDGTGVVRRIGPELRVEIAPELANGIVSKGSIAVDGVSLTVVSVGRDYFTCALIPTTRRVTTLGFRRPGERVNLELDILGKYVRKPSRITPDLLKRAGFID